MPRIFLSRRTQSRPNEALAFGREHLGCEARFARGDAYDSINHFLGDAVFGAKRFVGGIADVPRKIRLGAG
jgi:hypothetical protein